MLIKSRHKKVKTFSCSLNLPVLARDHGSLFSYPPTAASLVYTILPRAVQKVSELHLARDDLAAVNRELTEEIGQLKAELTAVIEERDQANITLQTVR